jgi:acyl carrier protein
LIEARCAAGSAEPDKEVDLADIESGVLAIIAKQARREPATLTRDTHLADLDIQSLDVVEIIFEIEEKFDISIPYNANDPNSAGISFETVGDVTDAVARLVGDGSARSSA